MYAKQEQGSKPLWYWMKHHLKQIRLTGKLSVAILLISKTNNGTVILSTALWHFKKYLNGFRWCWLPFLLLRRCVGVLKFRNSKYEQSRTWNNKILQNNHGFQKKSTTLPKPFCCWLFMHWASGKSLQGLAQWTWRLLKFPVQISQNTN